MFCEKIAKLQSVITYFSTDFHQVFTVMFENLVKPVPDFPFKVETLLNNAFNHPN